MVFTRHSTLQFVKLKKVFCSTSFITIMMFLIRTSFGCVVCLVSATLCWGVQCFDYLSVLLSGSSRQQQCTKPSGFRRTTWWLMGLLFSRLQTAAGLEWCGFTDISLLLQIGFGQSDIIAMKQLYLWCIIVLMKDDSLKAFGMVIHVLMNILVSEIFFKVTENLHKISILT